MEESLTSKSEEETLFRPVSDLMGMYFSVKDYQRGYKWGAKEILELLNDINEHDINHGKYCLQPVIVRENGKETELIDGQQRITSIYLILTYLNNSLHNIYSISYETREESKEFLSNTILELNQFAENKLSWEDFIRSEAYRKYDNVDVYHFYTVYSEIVQWFDEKNDESFKKYFLNKLLNTVHIIWYDIDKSNNFSKLNIFAEAVFTNLNAGKIPLTSSELIKALFILDTQNKNSKEVAKLKSTELALEWDQIENKLHDDSFWFFICDNDKYNSAATRIDFLIDIVNKRDVKRNDELFSYRIYEKRFKEKAYLDWMEIKNTYNKLIEWFDNKEIYHFVGFLIVSGIKSLNQILSQSKGISKAEFNNSLKESVKSEFKRTRKDDSNLDYLIYDLDCLDYQESRKECEKVLLLLNILYYVNNLSDNKFPFELYKNETWSVEHINPQNPRDFETVAVINKWLLTNKLYYQKNTGRYESILNQIAIVSGYFERIKSDDKRKLADLKMEKEKLDEFDSLFVAITTDLDLHGISNLALLDKNSNSKLGNKGFLEKRELILQFDKEGKYITTDGKEKKVFIPVCTKNVFAKIYTSDKDSLIDSFFGKNDMKAYYRFIETQLMPFFTK